jgi:hypothetical protein
MKKSLRIISAIIVVGCFSLTAYAQTGDVESGEQIFQQSCAVCHGDNGEGRIGPTLIGCNVCDSVESLFNKIEPDMPSTNPSSCVDQCAWDVATFIFEVFNDGGTPTTIPDDGGCPITEIYGKDSEEVELLRQYRDAVLAKTPEGQKLLRLYYKWSPFMIQVVEDNEQVKIILQTAIDALFLPVRQKGNK